MRWKRLTLALVRDYSSSLRLPNSDSSSKFRILHVIQNTPAKLPGIVFELPRRLGAAGEVVRRDPLLLAHRYDPTRRVSPIPVESGMSDRDLSHDLITISGTGHGGTWPVPDDSLNMNKS